MRTMSDRGLGAKQRKKWYLSIGAFARNGGQISRFDLLDRYPDAFGILCAGRSFDREPSPLPAAPVALARLPQLARDFGEFRHNRDHNYLFSLQPHSISLCSADLAY